MTTNGIDTPALADLTEAAVKELRVASLRAISRAEGLPADGRKRDLAKRLIAKKRGGARGYIAGKTLCKHCGSMIEVKGTSTTQISRRKVALTRFVRCTGKRRHSYQIVEIVEEGGR